MPDSTSNFGLFLGATDSLVSQLQGIVANIPPEGDATADAITALLASFQTLTAPYREHTQAIIGPNP